ncbi:MAG: 6-carboxytetrahydropterin synthase QueD [bacterium]
MFLTKNFMFEAAHRLPNYNGKCEALHGHSYRLEVTVSGKLDTKSGMIVDFGILKKIVKENVVDVLDHSYINNIIETPTAENMVLWMNEKLEKNLREQGVSLHKMQLWETRDSSVTLISDNDFV